MFLWNMSSRFLGIVYQDDTDFFHNKSHNWVNAALGGSEMMYQVILYVVYCRDKHSLW